MYSSAAEFHPLGYVKRALLNASHTAIFMYWEDSGGVRDEAKI